jgi:hypothetical protein
VAAHASTLETVRRALGAPVLAFAGRADGDAAHAFGRAFVAFWLFLTGVLFAVLAGTVLRYRAARRRWPPGELAGARVRVAPASGPAVIGFVRPEIVVPAWLLDAPMAEQRLVIAHEREHVRAGDHRLLGVACIVTALLPWHPAVWWMAVKLRLAIELDCDARVLRAGVSPAAYGTLLVAIASRRGGLPAFATALADAPSQLERRLLAMTTRLPRHAALRGGVLAAVAALFVAAACEMELPTAAQIEALDVAAAEAQAANVGLAHPGAEPRYFVDGIAVLRDDAHALPPDRIARIEIVRARLGEDASSRDRIQIFTTDALERAARVEVEAADRAERLAWVRARESGDALPQIRARGGFDGLVIIDGRAVDATALSALRPDRIERIEVVKGAEAARLYTEPAARNGVIHITTKGSGGH